MRAQLLQFVFGSVVLWVVAAAVAYPLAGMTALLDTALACALCLLPLVGTMLWCGWALAGAPEQQLLAILGGTGVRLLVVIAGGIGLFQTIEGLHRPAFLLWLVVFYLATLTLEVVVVVRRQNALAGSPRPLKPEQ
jgi:hypothetical protein